MRFKTSSKHRAKTRPVRPSLFTRLRKDESGTTAIEFALVSIPFLVFVFSTFALAMHFFTTSALEHGVDVAARKLRTGQAESSAMTNEQFRDEICTSAFLDCSKVQIHVSSGQEWADVSPADCTDGGGNMSNGTGAAGGLISDQGGAASTAYVVTACYEWELAQLFPFIDAGALTNGSGLIQASTAGRSEPFN